MRIGLFAGTDGASVESVVELAKDAEAAGFASIWLPQTFGIDAITALTVASLQTTKLELGTGVVPTYPRHPMMLAAQSVTAQQVSNGRFCLGIGLSHQPVIEGMFAMSFDKPVRHLREYLSILVPMCRGEKVDVRASTLGGTGALTIRDAKPVQVIVAALGEQTIRVSAELADGTFTWCVGPHTLADHTIPTMTKAAQNAGRPAPRIVAGIPVCVTNDAQAAHDRAARSFAVYATLPSYRAMLDREGASILADIAIIGDEDHVAKRIRGLADLGVTDYAASEFGGREDRVRTRELLKSLV